MIDKKWCNNPFNARINKEFPKKFSLCDLDGVIRFQYKGGTRLIIYEVKRSLEYLKEQQEITLWLLKESIDWSKYDNQSGVFVIRALDDNFDKCDIYSFSNEGKLRKIATYEFKEFRKWFYNDK
jgi:hypothetical protein